jgi:AcrR family transcriptional regulator
LPSGKAAAVAKGTPAGARERILGAAYELFSRQGIGAVGVDTIIARSSTAKMSLYRHFRSKEELVLAFLERRERLWTFAWLQAEITARAGDPVARLLTIFDVFDDWFRTPEFEGCSFINVLLESKPQTIVHQAAAAHLAEIRKIVANLAAEARLADPAGFARTWHLLMKGCIIAAQEGHREAAVDAKQAGELILRGWPRQARP